MTAQTPLDRLPWFSAMLIERLTPFDEALLIIDQVVFFDDPPPLREIRRAAGESRTIFEAPGHLFDNDLVALRAALEAALSEWVDFRILFSPPDRALLADHDEYTTVFSKSAEAIAGLRSSLKNGQVLLPEYVAPPP